MHLPKTLWLMLVGNSITGISCSIMFVKVLPEMINVSIKRLGKTQRGIISDYSTAILVTMINLGDLIGPLLSSWLASIYDYQFAYEVLALICAAFFIIYLMAAGCRSYA